MTTSIIDAIPTQAEVVLQERLTSSEFVIREIQENIRDRRVQVLIELGPFVTEDNGNKRGSSMRNVTVWQNEDYDAVRDTWRNDDLIAKVKTLV